MSILVNNISVNEYIKYITKYIIKELEDILGDNAIRAIGLHLGRSNLRLSDICYKPEEIRSAFYKMFGNGAYRLEASLVKSIYKLLDLNYHTCNNLVHAINVAMIYYKLSHTNVVDIYEILEIIDISMPLYCKSCDQRLELTNCSYECLLTELCPKCYTIQNTLYDTFNKTF
mgnify:CR=1 FL=1